MIVKKKSKTKAFVKDLYWIPKKNVDMHKVKNNFTFMQFEPDIETGEMLELLIKVYRVRMNKHGVKFVGMPRGKPNLIKDCLVGLKLKDIKDRRTTMPQKIPLKMKGKYYSYQKKAIKKLSNTDGGVLKSMPRTGKCLVGDTLVPTNFGIYRLDEIPIDFKSIEKKGGESWADPRLTNMKVATINGIRPIKKVYKSYDIVYKVLTNFGFTITGTEDERLMVNGKWVKIKNLDIGDNVQLQSSDQSIWRALDIPYNNFPDKYTDLYGKKVIPRLATLIAYKPNIILENITDTHVICKLQSTSACVKYGSSLISGKFEGHTEKNKYHIPLWLWGILEELESKKRVPRIIMLSNKRIVLTYIKALYEVSNNYSLSKNLEWELYTESLAQEIQAVLLNCGVMLIRHNNILSANHINTKKFFIEIDIFKKESFVYWDKKDESTMSECCVESITKLTKSPVYDLSIYSSNKDDHNFIANGLVVHNTIMGAGAIIKCQEKTLILAHQTDLIEQFCYETLNDPKGKLFNGRVFKKRPIAGICKKYNDFTKYPICLATYQTFLSKKGRVLLKKIKDMFGIVLIDEVHRTPANRYNEIISKFSAKKMWGMTATDDRKDGKYILSELMIGCVVHIVDAPTLRAKVMCLETGMVYNRRIRNWNVAMNILFGNEKRNNLIAKYAVKDAKAGHIVLIPTVRVKHAQVLEEKINKLYGSKVCFIFTGAITKERRQWARDEMNYNKKIKICIATRSMLTGMNIARWSAIYTVAPTSNEPVYMQEIFRICTPFKNKKQPIIRYFFDRTLGLSYGCFNRCKNVLLDKNNGFIVDDSVHTVTHKESAYHKSIDNIDTTRTVSKKGGVKL